MKQAKSWLSIAAWLSVSALMAECGRPSLKEVFGVTLNQPVSPSCALLASSDTHGGETLIEIVPPKSSSAFKTYAISVDATNKVVRMVMAFSSEPEKAVEVLRQRYGQPNVSRVGELEWTDAQYFVHLFVDNGNADLVASTHSWAIRAGKEAAARHKNLKELEH